MKKRINIYLFHVSFKRSDNVCSTDIVLAHNEEEIRQYYRSKYAWYDVRLATDREIALAIRREIPITKLI